MVPHIVCEKERDEDMATNLRVSFKERQCKRFSESITVVPPPTKKPYMEVLCPVPVSTIHLTSKPPFDVVGPNRSGPSHVPIIRPSVGKDTRPELDGPSTNLVPLNNDSVECVASISPHPPTTRAPSRKEMVELLK